MHLSMDNYKKRTQEATGTDRKIEEEGNRNALILQTLYKGTLRRGQYV